MYTEKPAPVSTASSMYDSYSLYSITIELVSVGPFLPRRILQNS